jgi:phospholipase C
MSHKRTAWLLAALAASAGSVFAAQAANAGPESGLAKYVAEESNSGPRTPIKHLVVIFQENVSFDHYFGTYPKAANTDGQSFTASPHTPGVDGLPPSFKHSTNLLTNNPNSAPPLRLDSSPTGLGGSPGGQLTCDQNHEYTDEQTAFNGGQMNHFVESVGTGGSSKTPFGTPCLPPVVMDYYDGNTVTSYWNYAQHFAMSDNSYSTTFGPSSPGAISLVSGNTGGVDMAHTANNPPIGTPTAPNGEITPDGQGGYSMIGDPQPYWDDCSTRDAVGMTGQNVGDLLNAKGLSWGWFQGGTRPSISYTDALAATGHTGQPTSTFIPNEFKAYGANNRPPHSSNQAICNVVHPVGLGLGGTGQWGYKNDYIPHHEPFNYYSSTANPHHLTLPTESGGNVTLAGLRQIGTDTQSYKNGVPQFDKPNHNYDVSDFDQLVSAITQRRLPASALPAVSFVKAPGYQDGHAAYSDPKDEQQFVTNEINALMKSPDWSSTAVIVAYDDSDGWYDHAYAGVINPSHSPSDNLTNTTFTGPTSGQCGPTNAEFTVPLAGQQGRCGFGPRQPLIVVSPFARRNDVDHSLSNLASIPNLIEYNWGLPSIAGSADQVLSGGEQAFGSRRRFGEHGSFDLAGLFKFEGRPNPKLILDPNTGQPAH